MGNPGRWFLEGERKRKEAAKKKQTAGASGQKQGAVGPISNLASVAKQTIGNNPDKTRKIYRSVPLTRTRAIRDRYNEDTLSGVFNFLKGNAKQYGSGLLSTVGTVRRKVGGTDMMSYMDAVTEESKKRLQDETRTKYYGTKIGDAALQRAKENTKKLNQDFIDTADRLAQSGAKDLEKVKEGKNGFEKRMIDLGSGAIQLAGDVLLSRGAGTATKLGTKGLKRLTNATSSVRSMGGAATEARQGGATEDEQLMYGLLSGSVTYGTNKIGNLGKPFSAMYGKGMSDDLAEAAARFVAKKAKTKGGKDLTYNLARLGLTALEEGTEEGLEEIASPFLKNRTYSEGETVDWDNVFYAATNGAILGGTLGGAGQAIEHSRNKRYVEHSGLGEKDNLGALIGEGLASDETTAANKIARHLKDTIESGREVTPTEIVAQQKANTEAIQAETYAYEKQKGVAESAATKQGLAPIMIDNGNGETIVGGATAQRLKETTGRVAQKLIATQAVDEGTAMDKAASISRIMIGMGDGTDFTTLLPTMENEPARQVYMEETGTMLPDTNEGTRTVLSQANMENMLMMRREETAFQAEQQKAEVIKEAETSFGKEGAAVFANAIQESDGDYGTVMQEFKNYYDGGIVNYPAVQIDARIGKGTLSNPIKMAAWNAGYNDSVSRRQVMNAVGSKAVTSNTNPKTFQQKKGNFKSHVAPTVVPKEKQDALRRLAKELNANIELHSVLEHDANGYYKNGTIHLSAKTNNSILNVFKHELTHHIQETAPAEYQKLKDFVMQEYYKGDQKAFQKAIDEKVRAYAKQEEPLTRDEAVDEIIANTAEKFLTNEAEIEKIVKQDRTLGQAILDAIKNMIDSIKEILQGSYSKELIVLKKAEKLWAEALRVSVKSEANVNRSVIKYSRETKKKDIVSIKEQIKQNIHELNKMEPVARIKSEGFRGKTDKQILDDVVREYKKYGMGVDRKDFGFISLEEALVNNSLNYLSTEAEYAAFSTLPRVLKRGMEIRDKEHKGRGHNTITFAAPVAINEKVGIVGVVVKRTKGNRYKTHRIVMPDGSAYVFEYNKTEATTDGMTDTKNGEGPTITSVSENSISNRSKKNKKQFSLKDSDGRQLTDQQAEFFKDSQFRDNDGNLLPMYHGTAEEFWTFEHRKAQDLTGRRMGFGAGKGKFYFSRHKAVAKLAAQSAESMGRGDNVNVKEVYLNAKKIMGRSEYQKLLETEYEKIPEANPQDKYYDYQERDRAIERIDKKIKSQGYDGVFDEESGEAFVFNPNQIKDVTNENPTINPDIRYSLKEDETLNSFGIKKLNDYVHVQKQVLSTLDNEGFFGDTGILQVEVESTGAIIDIGRKGIRETLGNGKRFATLPRKLKLYKLATIRRLPEIIKASEIDASNVRNYHGEQKKSVFDYFSTPVEINNQNCVVRIAVKKSHVKNKFWIHDVDIISEQGLNLPHNSEGINEFPAHKDSVTQTNDGDKKNYSLKDHPGEQALIDYVNAGIETKFKKQGYDGIVDTRGKNGGDIHQVAIPFRSEQAKAVDNKEPTGDPDIRYSLKEDTDISYHSLVAKPEMIISIVSTSLDDIRNLSRREIVANAKKLLNEKVGQDNQGRITIYNNDTQKDIVIGKPGIEHGLDRNYEYTAIVSMHLDSYLKHAIKINEAVADNGRKFDSDILLGYGENQNGEKLPAYFVVSKLATGQDELLEFGSLYSARAKKIVEDSAQGSPGVQSRTSTTISIADLLDIVNKMYSDILPKSVADYYGNTRKDSKLGRSVVYSLKDHPDEQALIDYVNTGVETKFTDMPPVRDYDKKAKTVRMKSVEELTRQVEQLQQETKLTHGKMPDQRDLINQSTNLVRTLMDGKVKKNLVDMAANNTSQMFTLIKRGHEEDAIIQAYNTARELVENLDLVDDLMYTEYKSLRDYLRQTPIKVSDNHKPVDYEAFRKSQLGRLKLTSREGLPIDTIYEELKELYPALFSEDIISPADQLQEIADVRESLEPYDVMLSDEETEQLIKETASSLLEIAYNGKPRQTFADKKKDFFDAKVKRLKEEQTEAKEKIRKQYQGIVKKHDEKARQRRIEDKQKVRNKAEKKKSVGSIEKNVGWLSDRLVKPTDEKHLPHGFNKAVADLLQCFDLQTERSKALEVKFGKAKKTLNFENLMRQYQKIAKEDGSGEIEYDGYVFDMMDALAEKLQGKTIDQASNRDLKDIDTLLKAVVGNFKNMNKAFTDDVKVTISDMGDAAIAEFQRRTAQRKGKGKRENLLDRLLHESMVTPRDFFELMGGNMDTLYGNIRKGFDQHVKNIDQTRKFFEDMFGKWWKKKGPGSKIESWSEASSQKAFTLKSGSTVKMNPAQLMSLYCLMKREQAQTHILGSGIVVSEVSAGRKLSQKLRGERSNSSKTSFVTLEDVAKMIGTLTDEQIEVAENLADYLNTVCTKWGNETSMRMNNYEKFTEDNYFPIISAKEYLDADFSKRSNHIVETIKNASFTKNTAINANNPIMIADIFEVVTDHINKMSMYNAFAAPIADFQRVYNYKQRDESGLQTTSVQAEMREACGQKALEYIKNLMADLNNFGNSRREPFEALLNKGLAAYKKAAIGFNFRVAIQQPTAIARAFVHIDPIYFVNGKINLRKNLQEMKEHCPIALWKSWGFSQTDVARDMKDIIMNDNWTKLDLVSMMPYGALDNATWATIWAAVKTETEAKHKDVKVGSDQFWEICSERAAYIYDKTQVVDSPLHRSQVMRNQNVGLKMLTSFMAEPTRTFNMCRTEALKGVQDIKDGNVAKGIGEISRVSTVFLLNAALVSAAAAVADAIREKLPSGDDDEEKSKAEYWLINFWANLGDNLNPLNMIPVLKEYGSIKDGWGTSNMALEGAEAIITAATNWQKYMNGETDKTPSELMRKSAEAVGMVTGVPVKNIIREFESWTKLLGLEVHAATEDDEAQENTNWLLDKFGEFKAWMNKSNAKDDGSDKKSSDKKAWKDKSYDEKLEAIKEATKDLSGSELEEKIWDKATYGYTTLIDKADFAGIAETRKLLEEAGGDVDKFDESVSKAVKSAFKKCIGEPDDAYRMAVYREKLYEYGYTDAKISQEFVAKSETAKEFKKACALQDDDTAVETLQALRDAGITYQDAYALYLKRSDGIKAADYSSGELAWPVDGDSRISSYYGPRSSPGGIGSTNHQGIDIAASAGTNVIAADGGKVSYAGYNRARGYYVDVDHGNGRKTRYQHLQGYTVWKGDIVKKGQLIAYVGSTGNNSTGPHLHIEVLEGGQTVDPMIYFH